MDQPEDAHPNASPALSALHRAQQAAAAARAEIAAAGARIALMEKARRAERLAHDRQVTKAKAGTSRLRKELRQEAVTEAPVARGSGSRSHLMLSLVAIVVLAAIAGLCVRYVDPLHTWDGRSKVTPHPAQASTQEALPSGQVPAGSAETHALSRLNDAVQMVPAPAAPFVLKAANQWLGSTGEQACSVESPQGEVSLVVSGRSGEKPLLAALSRCAQAVEHLMQPEPGK